MGEFIEKIENRKNIFDKIKKELNEKKIILFDNDDITKIGYKRMIESGINKKDILTIEKSNIDFLIGNEGKYNILVCNRHPKESLELLRCENINRVYLYDLIGRGNYELSYDFVCDNKEKLEEVYNMFYDKESKEIFKEFINTKISGDYSKLIDLETYGQYIEKGIVNLDGYKLVCDCGSFDGTDIIKFKNATKNDTLKVVSLEPDINNYITILKNMKNKDIKNVDVYNLGAWNEKGELRFSSHNETTSCSCISMNGEETINVDCIDNILKNEKCDYLKMDIEGAELNALAGAKKTILNSESDLAICIYHKKEDLYDIPLLIKELVEGINKDYKFYVRLYNKLAVELVFYALKIYNKS